MRVATWIFCAAVLIFFAACLAAILGAVLGVHIPLISDLAAQAEHEELSKVR